MNKAMSYGACSVLSLLRKGSPENKALEDHIKDKMGGPPAGYSRDAPADEWKGLEEALHVVSLHCANAGNATSARVAIAKRMDTCPGHSFRRGKCIYCQEVVPPAPLVDGTVSVPPELVGAATGKKRTEKRG